MATTAPYRVRRGIHPLHAVLLASILPLFLGGLLSDLAYSRSYEIQWSNFASWLIAGGMVFTGVVMVWALIDLLRSGQRRGRPLLYFLLLLAVFILGLLNSFTHARDAWGIMPGATILSAIVAVLAIGAIWVGFSSLRSGDAQ